MHKAIRMSHTGCWNGTYLEILSNLTDETLEGQLPDKELGGLLVPSDFTKGDSSRAETMGLLHTTSGGLKRKSH